MKQLVLILFVLSLFVVPADIHWITVEWVNDPYYGVQWGFEVVNAEEAWAVVHGDDVDIAIVDTGAYLLGISN